MTSIEENIKFCEDAMMNNRFAWKKREPSKYYSVEIVNCMQKDWWYKDHIGQKFLAIEMHRNYFGIEIAPVRLTNTKMNIGRTLLLQDCIIL